MPGSRDRTVRYLRSPRIASEWEPLCVTKHSRKRCGMRRRRRRERGNSAVLPLADGRWGRAQLRPRTSDPLFSFGARRARVGWLVAGSGECRGGRREGKAEGWDGGFRNGARWGARQSRHVGEGGPTGQCQAVGQGLLSRQVDFVSIWICSMLVIFFRLAGNPVDQRHASGVFTGDGEPSAVSPSLRLV